MGHEQPAVAALRLRARSTDDDADRTRSTRAITSSSGLPTIRRRPTTIPSKDGDTAELQRCPTCTANPGKGVLAMRAEAFGPFGAQRVIEVDDGATPTRRKSSAATPASAARTSRTAAPARRPCKRPARVSRRKSFLSRLEPSNEQTNDQQECGAAAFARRTRGPLRNDGSGGARARGAESVRAARSAALSEALHAEHHLRRRSAQHHAAGRATGITTTRTSTRGATRPATWRGRRALGLVQGVNIANQNNAPYYRKFVNRTYTAAVNQGGGVTSDFAADSITAVGNLASGYSTFYEKTRSWSPGARSRRSSTRTRTSHGSGC